MGNSKEAKILVIEDEPGLAQLYQLVGKGVGLSPEAFAVVDSTADAEKLLGENPDHLPQLILLNLHLPGEYGLTFLQRIKEKDSPLQHIPVVVVTAEVFPDVKKRCQDLGAADCLIKPFHIETLRETIQSLLPRTSPTE